MTEARAGLPETASRSERREKSLIERTSRYSLGMALAVFFFNMAAVWWITNESARTIGRDLVRQEETAVSLALQAGAINASMSDRTTSSNSVCVS